VKVKIKERRKKKEKKKKKRTKKTEKLERLFNLRQHAVFGVNSFVMRQADKYPTFHFSPFNSFLSVVLSIDKRDYPKIRMLYCVSN